MMNQLAWGVENQKAPPFGACPSLPCFHLFSHRLEVSLHPIDANRDAVNERERF